MLGGAKLPKSTPTAGTTEDSFMSPSVRYEESLDVTAFPKRALERSVPFESSMECETSLPRLQSNPLVSIPAEEQNNDRGARQFYH